MMRKCLKRILSGIAFLFATGALCLAPLSSAQAGLIAWDNFDSYAPGTSANGLDGGYGWGSAWGTAFTGNQTSVSSHTINFSAGGITRGGGNSIKITANQNYALGRQVFDVTDTSGRDYFMSFIFQVRNADDSAGSNMQAFGLWGATDGRNPNGTGAAGHDGLTSGGFTARRGLARVGGTAGQGQTSDTLSANETYFMVIGYSGWDGTTYTTATIWLYDSNQAVIGQATGLSTTAHADAKGSAGMLGLQLRTHFLTNSQAGAHINRTVYLDDIRFGDSWDAVVTGIVPKIATDSFNSYTAGAAVHGLNSGYGWAGAWESVDTAGSTVSVSSDAINFRAGGVTRGGGNSIKIGRNADLALGRQIFAEKDTSGQPYFLSFIFQVRDANSTSGESTLAFGTWGAADGRAVDNVQQLTLGGIKGPSGLARVGGTAGEGQTAPAIVYNETYFMVIGYSGWDGTAYTTAMSWLYDLNAVVVSPMTGLFATADVAGLGSQGVLGLQLRTAFLTNSPSGAHINRTIYFDDIRFGDSWDTAVWNANTYPDPNVFIHFDYDELLQIKARIHADAPETRTAFNALINQANTLLTAVPRSVMDKAYTPPSGDMHDYFDIGNYSWPNPDTPDGLPYIRRDGINNPEAMGPEYDKQSYIEMYTRVNALTLAWFYTDNEAYAAKAAQLLRTWFLAPATRMNPNLNHAAAQPGVHDGAAIGIIVTVEMIRLVDSLRLLRMSESWTAADEAGMQAWFRDYTTWLLESELGKKEAKAKDNHGSWYAAQVAVFALYTGDGHYVRAMADFGRRLINGQVAADGSLPLEMSRNRSRNYALYGLQSLAVLARAVEGVNEDLWHHQTADDRGLELAFAFLAPYLLEEEEWPVPCINNDFNNSTVIEVIRLAARKYQTPELYDALDYRLQKVPNTSRTAWLYGIPLDWTPATE